MASGRTFSRYPNNLLTCEYRLIRSNVLQRKIAFVEKRPDGKNFVFCLLLQSGKGFKCVFMRQPYEQARTGEVIGDALETPLFSKQQARGIYDYVRSPKTYEGIRAAYGLIEKPYVVNGSEMLKLYHLRADWRDAEKRREQCAAQASLRREGKH